MGINMSIYRITDDELLKEVNKIREQNNGAVPFDVWYGKYPSEGEDYLENPDNYDPDPYNGGLLMNNKDKIEVIVEYTYRNFYPVYKEDSFTLFETKMIAAFMFAARDEEAFDKDYYSELDGTGPDKYIEKYKIMGHTKDLGKFILGYEPFYVREYEQRGAEFEKGRLKYKESFVIFNS